MADIVESTPAELNAEGDIIKEKTCEDVIEKTTEKGDGPDAESPIKATVDTTDDVQSTGTKRKSDEAENEDEEAKKVKKGEGEEEVNGSDKSADNTTEEKEDAPDSKEEEEVVKKVVDEEETPATEVTSS